jgi:hypothetical protein
MSDDQQAVAALRFQERLASLHEAQARLASVEAALHRLAIARATMPPGEAEKREADLMVRHQVARTEVDALRLEARRAHTTLRRFTDPDAEPDDLEPSPPGDHYEQPPFGSPR